MVRVTDQAVTALEELLAENAAPPDAGIRLTPSAGGNLGMVIDAPHEGDEVVQHNETPVLILDEGVAPGLRDLVVDYQDGASSSDSVSGFVLRPPSTDD